jgi:mannose-6-phosphate isomerase-like protein (cupin superfamily)
MTSSEARLTTISLEELATGPTAALFEGGPRAGSGISMFVVRTPPGRTVELHTHPYPETFVLLEGRARWTAGTTTVEMDAGQVLVVPPETPHGFRNTGDEPLLLVSAHESPEVIQTWLGEEPA